MEGFSGPVGTGDLNGDRVTDIVLLQLMEGRIEFFWGRKDSTLDYGGSITLEKQPRNLAIDDLDGDGISDLVVVAYGVESLEKERGGGKKPPPSGPPESQLNLTAGPVVPQGQGVHYARTGVGLGATELDAVEIDVGVDSKLDPFADVITNFAGWIAAGLIGQEGIGIWQKLRDEDVSGPGLDDVSQGHPIDALVLCEGRADLVLLSGGAKLLLKERRL